jgi:hypothetical protein
MDEGRAPLILDRSVVLRSTVVWHRTSKYCSLASYFEVYTTNIYFEVHLASSWVDNHANALWKLSRHANESKSPCVPARVSIMIAHSTMPCGDSHLCSSRICTIVDILLLPQCSRRNMCGQWTRPTSLNKTEPRSSCPLSFVALRYLHAMRCDYEPHRRVSRMQLFRPSAISTTRRSISASWRRSSRNYLLFAP